MSSLKPLRPTTSPNISDAANVSVNPGDSLTLNLLNDSQPTQILLHNDGTATIAAGLGTAAIALSGIGLSTFNLGNGSDTLSIAAGATVVVNLGSSNGSLTIANDGTLTINAGTGSPSVQFAVAQPIGEPKTPPPPRGSLAGRVYNDLNANGFHNVGDKGLAGRTVYIDSNRNGKLDPGEPQTATAADGTYRFSNLAAGRYLLREIVPGGWRASNTSFYDLALNAGQNRADKDFALTQLALISGTVFHDKNGNGQQDPADAGLAGWVVYLDINNDGKLDKGDLSFTTGTDGKYSFAVAAGKYLVREIAKRAFTPTTSLSDAVSLEKAGAAPGKNFGQR